MTQTIQTDLCVIGAGSGGLSVAAGAAQMGARVVLIEKNKMGGDCLNYGCVPSKSLLAAAKAAYHSREAAKYGVHCKGVTVDFKAVHDHVHDVIARIAPHDSVERFEKLGVKVVLGSARFVNAKTITVNKTQITAKRIILACGSSPVIPSIPGLDTIPFLTNETIFSLTQCPSHLIVIGGGPIGIEMAQAHRRLGAKVTVIQSHFILPRDDVELVEILRQQLKSEGIEILENAQVTSLTKKKAQVEVAVKVGDAQKRITGTHVLVATGRKPNIGELNLEAAGVNYHPRGIMVDNRLRTNIPHIYAIGDCSGGPLFTHIANYHAGLIIREVLFKVPAKTNYAALPWTTYTDPELAQIGLTLTSAQEQYKDIQVLRFPLVENDRAQAERSTNGLIKVITNKSGQVLGASIVGPHAGELLLPWGLAIMQKMKLSVLAQSIVPYPTLSEISKSVAGSYYTPKLFSTRVQKLVRFLLRFP
jgi:dihydrolipoamide dehydrogenase